METYGLDDSFSSLHPVLQGRNPDSSFSTIPYEKGYQLLVYLEQLLGETDMQSFINYYISTHSLTSITTVELRKTWEYFVENMLTGKTGEEINTILYSMNWNEWLYVPGLAPVDLDFTTTESEAA